MKKVIENIRSRPVHHQNRIVWISAGVAVALLLIIWMIVGNGRKTTPDENFFQNFQQEVQSGKNIVPADPANQPSN
jgi:hypothetical protein